MRNPVDRMREIAQHAKRLARLEVELRTYGLKEKAITVGIGSGLGLLALLLTPLLLGFLLATLAAGLATAVDVWLAILIVSLLLLVVVGGLAGAAFVLIKSVQDEQD